MLAIIEPRAVAALIDCGAADEFARAYLASAKPAAIYDGARYHAPATITRAAKRWRKVGAWWARDWQAFRLLRDSLEAAAAQASRHLQHVSGTERGPMGLTPDHVKASSEWQAARRAYDGAAAQLRALRDANGKRFDREARAEREAARADRLRRAA